MIGPSNPPDAKPSRGTKRLRRYTMLQFRHKFLESKPRLTNDAFECAGFERVVLRDHNGAAFLAWDQVGACLADLNKTQTLQGAGGLPTTQIARDLMSTQIPGLPQNGGG